MMVSYAQDAEDVLLQRVFPRDYRGFYIDAGASDPVYFSITKHFYDLGWRGVNIEPVPSVWERLRDQRPRDVNLNVGLSNRVGPLTFYEVPSETSWSTFDAEVAEGLRNRGVEVYPHEIPVITLARVCEEHVDAPIDVLKIDVEGHELEVITGGDWARWRPRVVLVENNDAQDWEPLLLGHGYLHAITSEINRYYVREEDCSLLPRFFAPLSYQDSFVIARELDALRSMLRPAEEPLREVEAAPAIGEDPGPLASRPRRPAVRRPWIAAAGEALLRLAE